MKKKNYFLIDRTSENWAMGCFIIGLVVIFWTLSGCSTNVPKIDVDFWAGDSAKAGVSRAQEGKTLQCTDPIFDNYACLSYEDIRKIYSTILQCKQWGPALASTQDVKRMAKHNREIIRNVIKRTNGP